MKNCIFLLLLIFSTTNAQNKISEETFHSLQDKIRVLSAQNIDSAFILTKKLYQSDNYIHRAFSKGAQGYLYQLNYDSINSKKCFKESLLLINQAPKSIERTKNMAYLYNYGGLSDWKRKNYKEALIKYQTGEKYSAEVNDIIQLVKFNINTALINGEIGNYRTAIKKGLNSERLIEKNKSLYTIEQFNLNKSTVYLNVGSFYESMFENENKKNKMYLDSAFYYYKKTIMFSYENTKNKIAAELNLANIYLYKNQIKETEKAYQSVLTDAKENNLNQEQNIAIYNLGHFYFTQKKYSKALVYFQKTDSIYQANQSNITDFIYSNYYQSKIYESFNDQENSLNHANIYLEYFEKNEEDMIHQIQDINQVQNSKTLKKEMELMREKYSTAVFFKKYSIYFSIGIIALLIYFYIKSRKKNKSTELKYKSIINEYNEKLNQVIPIEKTKEEKNSNLNLDEEKENLLFEKLLKLEEQKVFLNQDFTLQFAAKKIKTNTTYLSYIVNKRFGKTFSEYANELKINYVINEMITNKSYRKYSTQAIAESVGYKNATSFTKLFTKKTGLSPVKFAEKLNSDMDSKISISN
ncbi:helix-turn-helix domain-containing protein [Flavobacterium urocaniciphilum]|uniref:Helix-turn-helix domain-containing protein n=1 Tax=Flavobacterium urocaniciphilum TaxID=1299341 RepID=A0A1H9DW30_9FLAO|nr:helix-turn-helix domain-containing protein [Flavobacterium urocaniciphilum]SEQ17083.1 Helix-turn-helix domain-containing protein [Flavobacterium urocaniciphilum]